MTSDDSQVFLSNFEKKKIFSPIKNFLDLENFQFSPSLNKRVVGSGHRRLPASSFVCLSAQNVSVCLCNCLSDSHEIFIISITTHVECFIDNYDIIGHMLWQQ